MVIPLKRNDQESLLYSLYEMQTQLAQTISEIAGSSKLVANASREISRGNLDLSRRTEQQSASLEKITSNVEQMTAIAKRYADSASHAGEQGRGFAVVAAEVRDLAQRSAAAAKEISNLIETSTN